MKYNPLVTLGPYDECGKLDVFRIWSETVNEARAKPLIVKFMDQYDLPIFVSTPRGKDAINAFFQAKYGMFTCYDSVHHIGRVEYDPELITYWERQPKKIKNTWYLAVLFALANGAMSWEDIAPYKKTFKEGE